MNHTDYAKEEQMLPKSVRNSLIALSLLLSLTDCSLRKDVVRPPAPEQLPAIQNPLSPAGDSVISVPVQLDLSTFLNTANDENVIPKKFDHWGSYIKTPKGANYKYYAERGDFAMDLSGAHPFISPDLSADLRDWWKGVELPGSYVSIGTALHYKIETDPHIAQCGDGSEWPRRATLNGSIAIEMTPNYGLSASVNGVTVNTIDSCKLNIAGSDISQEVKNSLADVVRGGLNNAVVRINAMTLKSHVEDAWNTLRKPIQLEPDTWLLLNIDTIRHSGFSVVGPVVDDTIQVLAKPVIVFGAEPPSASTALPQLETQPASTGFHIVADAQIEYATLSKTLANRLKGQRFSHGEDIIRITNASIYGNGGNRLVIRIDFTGDTRGHVYFVGKPEINALTQTVHISGLSYDSATVALLLKNTDWIYRSAFREFIASQAVLEVTPAIDRLRDLLATALNRPVTPAISMHGTVTSVQGIGVFADVKGLKVRAMSNGTLSVTVADKH